MSSLTIRERLRIARLGAQRTRRARAARTWRSPLLRWLQSPLPVRELLLVPSDLHPPDPSFLNEFQTGQIGLAGAVVDLGGQSPFAVAPPNEGWALELHGFIWLGHLRAAGGPAAVDLARQLVRDWISRSATPNELAWRPQVLARRVASWIRNSGLLLEGAEAGDFAAITRSLGAQIRQLDAARRACPPGSARLQCLMSLALADLAIAGREQHLARTEPAFLAELRHQILADGGHISRNPDVVLALLLELLPLRQCYLARERKPPPILFEAIDRMMQFLSAMRLGDGSLARFNGRARDQGDALAVVLAYETEVREPIGNLASSQYARLEAGGTIVLMDCGGPPPIELAGSAQAGCLSFELSHKTQALIVNGGFPGVMYADQQPAARATASHNTLCLDARSSARLLATPAVVELCGRGVLAGPKTVKTRIPAAPGEQSVEAEHDGYAATTALIHTRRLTLAGDGTGLAGIDRLAPRNGILRLKRDLPFAIHFHLARDTEANCDPAGGFAEFGLPGGPRWRLSVEGAKASIEASVDYDHMLGPRVRRQIVLRAACPGHASVTWSITRQPPSK